MLSLYDTCNSKLTLPGLCLFLSFLIDDKSKWNPMKCSRNSQEDRKRETNSSPQKKINRFKFQLYEI